jgi:hypothetical protein
MATTFERDVAVANGSFVAAEAGRVAAPTQIFCSVETSSARACLVRGKGSIVPASSFSP